MKKLLFFLVLVPTNLFAWSQTNQTYRDEKTIRREFNNIYLNAQSKQFTVFKTTPNLNDLQDGQIVLVSSTNKGLAWRDGQTVYFQTSSGPLYSTTYVTYTSNTYVSNGVSRIVAGTNITITPSGGTGEVTINSSGGGAGSVAFSDLTDVDDSGRAVNLVPKFNGTSIVWAAYNASFSFAIASFSDALSSTIEIGAGTWKAIGAITFTATYTNGPATGGYVSKSGWSNLNMTNSYLGPTSNAEAVSYPAVAGTVQFTLNATNGTDSPTSVITHTFYNRRFWGVSTVTSGFTEADVEGFASNELSNSKAKTFTVAPGAVEYIVFAYPSRLGTATFTVGGFEGGFNPPETVSITNASGYTENYYVYRSANPNLGSTSVTTT